ncbi:YidH family protein [Lolliginicoccus levis]|uniref:YidH family protein n=1 Tax=Lolliginicoccus levis TaxID=2919542 RepID=UPI00241FCD33|nr:DUF202 domain-containing protein [Lolliginicoccus levis]
MPTARRAHRQNGESLRPEKHAPDEHVDDEPLTEATRPDERFTLASERTFLAWIRTSLGLMVAGVALIHVVPEFANETIRSLIGGSLVVLAGTAAAAGLARWHVVERALRTGSDMPGSKHLVALTTVVVLVSAIAVIAIIADAMSA